MKRPACSEGQTGAWKEDAAWRRASNVSGRTARREAASLLGTADRRVVKLRPVPQEPCRRREEPASVQGALRPGCPRGRNEDAPTTANMSLRGDHRESEAQSFRSDPLGDCSESEAQSYAAGPGFGGRESSRFLGGKRWKSQKTASIIARTSDRRKGSGRGFRPAAPILLTALRRRCDRTETEPSSSTARR